MPTFIKRILIVVVVFVALLTASSKTAQIAYCESCPEARLSEGNFIKCLDGQNAWCKTGPSCGCNGRVKKDNQCGGACGVSTNWGACAIQCRNGIHATCKAGSVKWVGLQQVITLASCHCGGPGSVGLASFQTDRDNLLFVSEITLNSQIMAAAGVNG